MAYPDYAEISLDDSKAYQLKPNEYAGLVETVNDNMLALYRAHLASLSFPPDACIVAVGSDGKCERHEQSRSEFRILHTTGTVNASSLSRDIIDLLYPQNIQLDPAGRVETVSLTGDAPISYAFGNPNLLYPDRTLNARFVIGNPETFSRARTRVLAEMTADHDAGRRIRKRMKDQLSDYRKAAMGVFRGVRTFVADEATGRYVQFYNEDPSEYAVGFKSSMLRAVQRKLDLLTGHGIRERGWHIPELAAAIPTATIERIDFMAQRGLITPETNAVLTEAYAWFLQQYHRAQHQYKKTRTCVGVPFPPKRFAQHRTVILRFTYHDPRNGAA